MTVAAANPSGTVDLSIVAPAQNEEENISVLVREVSTALGSTGLSFELILVDDGSTDQTAIRMAEQARVFPWLRPLRLARRLNGKPAGKTAALYAGVRRATGRWLAFIDADLQNDPKDVARMLEVLHASGAALVQGNRCARRRDNWLRRVSSRLAWVVRRVVIGDSTRDSGCGFSVMTREVALNLPLQFSGMHRFLPVYTRLLGFTAVEIPVNHRPRIAGRAKYGIWNRALPALLDPLVIRWMRNRIRTIRCMPVAEDNPAGQTIASAELSQMNLEDTLQQGTPLPTPQTPWGEGGNDLAGHPAVGRVTQESPHEPGNFAAHKRNSPTVPNRAAETPASAATGKRKTYPALAS